MTNPDEQVRQGSCLCGRVRFRVKGRPLRVGLCHCQDCRRASGSFFTPFGVWPITSYEGSGEMKTFASLTGGRAYFPRFDGELRGIFGDIAADIRNQYTIAYHPTNTKLDGTYRKLKVELRAPDGGPLKVRDQKGKDVKVVVYAREGYTAKHQVE